jgi:hypothetical protein
LIDKFITTTLVTREVEAERKVQDERFGEQNHVDLYEENDRARDYSYSVFRRWADQYKRLNDDEHPLDWTGILLEEVYEALSESDEAKIRAELIQVAAVAVAWIECIDRRAVSDELETLDFGPVE